MARKPAARKGRGGKAANDDAPERVVEKDDNEKQFDGAALAEMLTTIAAAEARIKKRQEDASKRSEPDRKTIKDAKKELVDSGYPSRELALVIKKHKLEHTLENIDEQLDDDGKDTFAGMVEALGSYADTPLGRAALEKGR